MQEDDAKKLMLDRVRLIHPDAEIVATTFRDIKDVTVGTIRVRMDPAWVFIITSKSDDTLERMVCVDCLTSEVYFRTAYGKYPIDTEGRVQVGQQGSPG